MRLGIRLLIIVAFALLLSSPRIISKGSADGGSNHQKSNSNFGVSGGNVNDITKRFCCSGTLGSLVTDGANFYILSNDHVLGRSDQARSGEDVSQPGLVDNGCQTPPIVADFTVAPRLGSNVDAAIAQLRPGAMNTNGAIEDIGIPSSVVMPPAVGLGVAKSGRTTGFTTGSIASINTSVSVQYQAGCGQGKKFVVSYTNQVVINSSTFSAGGDSGSLIVTNDSNHQPVALLFAGSSTTTIGNPVGPVLTQVSAALGRTVSFVGTTQAASMATLANNMLSQDMEQAKAVKERHEREVMSQQDVWGMGNGVDPDSGEPTIVIFVAPSAGRAHALPGRLDNMKVHLVTAEQPVAR